MNESYRTPALPFTCMHPLASFVNEWRCNDCGEHMVWYSGPGKEKLVPCVALDCTVCMK